MDLGPPGPTGGGTWKAGVGVWSGLWAMTSRASELLPRGFGLEAPEPDNSGCAKW